MPDHTPVTTDDVTFGIRDRLLLAFAEREMYGIETQAGVGAAPARARAAITARLGSQRARDRGPACCSSGRDRRTGPASPLTSPLPARENEGPHPPRTPATCRRARSDR